MGGNQLSYVQYSTLLIPRYIVVTPYSDDWSQHLLRGLETFNLGSVMLLLLGRPMHRLRSHTRRRGCSECANFNLLGASLHLSSVSPAVRSRDIANPTEWYQRPLPHAVSSSNLRNWLIKRLLSVALFINLDFRRQSISERRPYTLPENS